MHLVSSILWAKINLNSTNFQIKYINIEIHKYSRNSKVNDLRLRIDLTWTGLKFEMK